MLHHVRFAGPQLPDSAASIALWVSRGGEKEAEKEGVGGRHGTEQTTKIRQDLELTAQLKLERHFEKSQVNQLTQICIIKES